MAVRRQVVQIETARQEVGLEYLRHCVVRIFHLSDLSVVASDFDHCQENMLSQFSLNAHETGLLPSFFFALTRKIQKRNCRVNENIL